MTVRALLVVPGIAGGEGVYASLLERSAPEGVSYAVARGVHAGAPGAPCNVPLEIALNRLVRPRAIPDIGFRALRLRAPFDLVHVHAHPARLGRLGETPVVMSEGSSSAVYLGDYLGWSAQRLARGFRRARRIYRALGLHDRLLAMERVSRVYVFSEWAREVNVRWGADPAKLEVVAPGFPVPEPVHRRERDVFRFLFVGRDFERKGGFDLVEAFAKVHAEHPKARLTMVGSNPWQRNPDRLIHEWVREDRRRRVLDQLEVLERRGLVTWRALVEPGAVHEAFYPSADAFVMPSLAEGFGFTNVEAMGYSLPVVSSRVGAIPEVVQDGSDGLLVAAGDVDGLAEAMSRLVTDPERALAMGESARDRFIRDFTLDGFRRRLGAVYRRALES